MQLRKDLANWRPHLVLLSMGITASISSNKYTLQRKEKKKQSYLVVSGVVNKERRKENSQECLRKRKEEERRKENEGVEMDGSKPQHHGHIRVKTRCLFRPEYRRLISRRFSLCFLRRHHPKTLSNLSPSATAYDL